MALERLSSPEKTLQILKRGFANNFWTIEDLDTPSPGYQQAAIDAERLGLTIAPWVNPLRNDPAQSVSPALPAPQEQQTHVRRSDSYVSSLGDGVDVVLGVTSDQPQNPATDADDSEFPF